MKAVVSREAGGPESLLVEEVDTPAPRAGEVLVRVRACGLNYPDLLMIADRYQFRPPRPFIPGVEIAGEVVALGDGVVSPAIGTRVMAVLSHGASVDLSAPALPPLAAGTEDISPRA